MLIRNKLEYETYKMHFAKRLRYAASESGMNLRQVAEEADITPQAVYKYAKGEALPNAYMLAKLAIALRVDVSKLLGISMRIDV